MAAIKEARYTSPSGNSHVFSHGNVSRTTELKTGTFTYPMRDGATVQHQGRGAMTFPLACIFHGINCMESAAAFEEALAERGTGELQHPIYGTHRVRPTGNILREDQLVTGMNRSIVTITFTESLDNEDDDPLNEVVADIIDENHESFEIGAAEDFAATIASIESVGEQLAVTAALETQAQSIIGNLQPLAMSDRRSFADWLASANELLDTIRRLYDRGISIARRVENAYVRALDIARLTLRLMKLPSRLATTLSSKIQGYAALTAVLINQFRNDPFETRKIRNAYSAAMLGLSGAVASIASGAAISTARAAASTDTDTISANASDYDDPVGSDRNSGPTSRDEAVETANRILEMFERVIAFSDARIAQTVSAYGIAALEALESQAERTLTAAQAVGAETEVLEAEAALAERAGLDALEALETESAFDARERLEARTVEAARESMETLATEAALAAQEIPNAGPALEALEARATQTAQAAEAAFAMLGELAAQVAQAVRAAHAALGALEGSTGNGIVDANSDSYINLKTLVFQSARLIMNASFALPMQRIFTLDRDRQIIELCAELYGTVDRLDEFIVSNNFSMDEIELLPMGTKVTHHVQSA